MIRLEDAIAESDRVLGWRLSVLIQKAVSGGEALISSTRVCHHLEL